MAEKKEKPFSFTNLHGSYTAHGNLKIPKVAKEFTKYKESDHPEELASAVRDVLGVGHADFTKHMRASKYNDNQLVRTANEEVKKGIAKSIIAKLKIVDYDSLKHITGLDISKLDAIQSGKEKLSSDTIEDLIRHYDEFAGTNYNQLITGLQGKKLKTLYANLKHMEDQQEQSLGSHLEDKLEDHIYSGINQTHFRTYHVAEAKKKGLIVDELHFSGKTKKLQREHHYLLATGQLPPKKSYSDHSWKTANK